jgi:PhoH-like ATPase
MTTKKYVLDTCVCLTDANSLFSYEDNDIIIPFKVLEEIDKHKKRQDSVGVNARETIRTLDELRLAGTLKNGVSLGEGKGILTVNTGSLDKLNSSFEKTDPDNEIISVALAAQEEYEDSEVILVSRDINMRIKCDSIGMETQDYVEGETIRRSEGLYMGFTTYLVDDEVVDRFYEGEEIYAVEEEVELFSNELVMLVSNANEKKTALSRFHDYNTPLKKLIKYDEVWGIRPRNKEQTFALELLMDRSVPVVTLIGRAGSGKTLCAIAAALQQTLECGPDESPYKRVIVSRPVEPMGKDIGYLPGTLEEKMLPWLSPIKDNLEFLMGDRKNMDLYVDEGMIEIEALTYIRGRSISNAFIIIDEAQQLTKHEIKTILTRVGEGTKIVFTGDIEQIDNVYVNETTNGLTYVVERFKNQDISGHITLKKGERSKVATISADIL